MKRKIIFFLIFTAIVSFTGIFLYSRYSIDEPKYDITNEISDNALSCEEKLNQIDVIGSWSYEGEEVTYKSLILQEDFSFEFFDTRGINSTGNWFVDVKNEKITITIHDNFEFWENEFFNTADFLVANIDGIEEMNKANYEITFKINNIYYEDCEAPYKTINFFGWYFSKYK